MIISRDLIARNGKDLIEREPETNTVVDTPTSNQHESEIRWLQPNKKLSRAGLAGRVEPMLSLN
jgi:hypothetical protein